MKKIFVLFIFVFVTIIAISCQKSGSSASGDSKGGAKKIGTTLYKFDDTFISTVRDNMNKRNTEKGSKADLNFADGQGQQATQFITLPLNSQKLYFGGCW